MEYKLLNKIGYIYCFTSPSGKCYIGQTWDIKRRYREHRNFKKQNLVCSKFYSAINKYGFETFIFDIIDYARSELELNEKEKYYISSFDSCNNGYNLTEGGENYKHSIETKNKMSLIKKEYFKNNKHHRCGSKISDSHKEILRNYAKNRVVSENTKLKQSEKQKGRPPNSGSFKSNNIPWNKNGNLKENTKNEIRLINLLKNKEKYGYIGIVPYKNNKWLSRVYHCSIEKCSKTFINKIDAAKWFDKKQIEYNGPNAPTNISLGFI